MYLRMCVIKSFIFIWKNGETGRRFAETFDKTTKTELHTDLEALLSKHKIPLHVPFNLKHISRRKKKSFSYTGVGFRSFFHISYDIVDRHFLFFFFLFYKYISSGRYNRYGIGILRCKVVYKRYIHSIQYTQFFLLKLGYILSINFPSIEQHANLLHFDMS